MSYLDCQYHIRQPLSCFNLADRACRGIGPARKLALTEP
nr:MAG TPA: hypothetical protein [Caudoviricetes sp.]